MQGFYQRKQHTERIIKPKMPFCAIFGKNRSFMCSIF